MGRAQTLCVLFSPIASVNSVITLLAQLAKGIIINYLLHFRSKWIRCRIEPKFPLVSCCWSIVTRLSTPRITSSATHSYAVCVRPLNMINHITRSPSLFFIYAANCLPLTSVAFCYGAASSLALVLLEPAVFSNLWYHLFTGVVSRFVGRQHSMSGNATAAAAAANGVAK